MQHKRGSWKSSRGGLLALLGLSVLTMQATAQEVYISGRDLGGTGHFGKFNLLTGAYTNILDMPTFDAGLTFAPNGLLYGGRSNELFTIDPDNGNTTSLGMGGGIGGGISAPGSLAARADGALFVDGSLGGLGIYNGPSFGLPYQGTTWDGLVFGPDQQLYAVAFQQSPPFVELFTRDQTNGVPHGIGSTGIGRPDFVTAIEFVHSTLYGFNGNRVVTLNTTTGQAALTGITAPFSVYAAASPVPEPGLLAFVGSGLFLGGMLRRRRK